MNRTILSILGFSLSLTLSVGTLTSGSVLNLGPEEIVQADGVDILVSGYSVPSFVDWNNDGLSDLVVGEGGGGYTGKVRVYLNVGTDSNPLFSTYSYAQSSGGDLTCTPSGCMGCFPRVVYWDADDRKDLLIGQADGTVKIYLNIGTDTAPTFDAGQWLNTRSTTLDVGNRATPDFVDWNNDGLTDLVVGGLDGYIHIYLNSGSTGGIPPSFDTMFSTGYLALQGEEYLRVPTDRSSPVIMDFDGDGKKDILTGNTEGQLFFYQNIGTDEAPLFSGYSQVTANGVPIDLSGNTRSRPSVCYWNGSRDGYLDVLIGYGDGKVHLYRGKPAAGDLDGDGDIDSSDFALFALCWFGPAAGDCVNADLIADGQVNFRDLQAFADIWLTGTE
jgi:hypothetical protein